VCLLSLSQPIFKNDAGDEFGDELGDLNALWSFTSLEAMQLLFSWGANPNQILYLYNIPAFCAQYCRAIYIFYVMYVSCEKSIFFLFTVLRVFIFIYFSCMIVSWIRSVMCSRHPWFFLYVTVI
jgi:hypothetical protein